MHIQPIEIRTYLSKHSSMLEISTSYLGVLTGIFSRNIRNYLISVWSWRYQWKHSWRIQIQRLTSRDKKTTWVYLSITRAKQKIINLLLVNNFYPVMYRRAQLKMKATNYRIRSLPAQKFKIIYEFVQCSLYLEIYHFLWTVLLRIEHTWKYEWKCS